jgi:hypothetical protein
MMDFFTYKPAQCPSAVRKLLKRKKKKTDVLMETFKTNGRYFEDPNPLIRCYNCNEHGHMSSTCPNPSYKFRCTYCGEQGHTAYSCSLVICHRCQGVGHKISQCNSDTRNKCDACGGSGHSYRSCIARDDPISAKYLSEITCLFCRRRGHVNCFSLKSYSKSLFCSVVEIKATRSQTTVVPKNLKNQIQPKAV